ncbi:phosphonate C-P lyase system protein PhnG [Fischerella thermalis CCMEE 5330]|uniref:Phosphonate C-P lyase system protein PhnG n=1 Tax=Fischerella thermalis CCMEE 5330 TaxID=2019670 RepID=A0A2N6MNT0_9CYAN|nr:phosphonate C-P lyase system protein PhnG [Fischerella thermalis CCMEE 5330]
MTTLYTRRSALAILSHSPAQVVRALADELLADLPSVSVLVNRTGLVMLPYTDTTQGTVFHLGEVLVSEAHIRMGEVEGYAMVTGRDTLHALAAAVIDAAYASGLHTAAITAFLSDQAALQQAADERLLRQVEATRVEMETF